MNDKAIYITKSIIDLILEIMKTNTREFLLVILLLATIIWAVHFILKQPAHEQLDRYEQEEVKDSIDLYA